MSWMKLSDDYFVSKQIDIPDMAAIAKAGFKTIINNRPAGEESGQPDSANLEREARRNGMIYANNPVIPGSITTENAARHQEHIRTLPKPILAFCRSGNRSKILYDICKNSG